MVGFHQSYTYFTWRNTKAELETYLLELSHESSDVMRPNLFVNTPDILTEYLQYGGPAAFAIRATLAATGSPTWGVYSGLRALRARRGAARLGGVPATPRSTSTVRATGSRAAASNRTLAPYLPC